MKFKDRLVEVVGDKEKIESLQRRLHKNLKENSVTGCIEWIGKALTQSGYGRMSCGRDLNFKAHRVAWFLKNGLIPENMFVCHKCDNPLCCNTDHLFLGTPQDNMKDMREKGRDKPTFKLNPEIIQGENSKTSKLKNEDVLFIRSSELPLKKLSQMFNVSETHIYRIKTKKAWGHLDDQ